MKALGLFDLILPLWGESTWNIRPTKRLNKACWSNGSDIAGLALEAS